ncbi:MAG: TrkA family potassium uptake protein [Chamaesiphon sp. CSU_1_12]|nr:TrkA family potassium uptake protein [Chamaesiphon sp. CSU_1_12]
MSNSVERQSFSFFRNLRPNKARQFAVIGLGRFGRAVCETLHQSGYEVLGTDINEKRVDDILTAGLAAHAIVIDSTNPLSLKEAGIFEFDTVIVSIGNYLQESIITTLNLKEAGVTNVIAKASSEVHAKLLQKVGADRVVLPEYEAGCNLAQTLVRPGLLESLDLDPEHSIVEIKVPESFYGKTIVELQLRSDYGINVLAIGQSKNFDINPKPDRRLRQDDVLVVIGNKRDLDRLPL